LTSDKKRKFSTDQTSVYKKPIFGTSPISSHSNDNANKLLVALKNSSNRKRNDDSFSIFKKTAED
jgi:hypothetical protein